MYFYLFHLQCLSTPSYIVSLLDDCNSSTSYSSFNLFTTKQPEWSFANVNQINLFRWLKPLSSLHSFSIVLRIKYKFSTMTFKWPGFCQICLLQLSFFSGCFSLFNPFDFWIFCFLCLEYFLSSSLCSRLTLSLEAST